VDNTWDEPEKEAETWWYGAWGKKTIDWCGEKVMKILCRWRKIPINIWNRK